MKLEGTVALVTGANRGLGRALVGALVEAGPSSGRSCPCSSAPRLVASFGLPPVLPDAPR